MHNRALTAEDRHTVTAGDDALYMAPFATAVALVGDAKPINIL